MEDEPTIEEAVARMTEVSKATAWLHDIATDESTSSDLADHILTVLEALYDANQQNEALLASHASLEESVKEAKRLMKPFAAVSLPKEWGDKDGVHIFGDKGGAGWMKVGDIRALAAFVNEKERTDG